MVKDEDQTKSMAMVKEEDKARHVIVVKMVEKAESVFVTYKDDRARHGCYEIGGRGQVCGCGADEDKA